MINWNKSSESKEEIEQDRDRLHLLLVKVVGLRAICSYCEHRDESKKESDSPCYRQCTSGSRSAFTPRKDELK